jgi:Xaa-Pro aminopeptidase
MLLNRARLTDLMKKAGIPVLISAKPENAIYLTSYHPMGSRTIKDRLTYVLYFADEAKAPLALCPSVDLRQMRELSWLPEDQVMPFVEFKTGKDQGLVTDKFGFLAEQIRGAGYATDQVGVETSFLPENILNSFRAALPDAKFVNSDPVIKRARAVKTPEEIERLRKACRATEAGCKKLIECASRLWFEDEAAAAARAASMMQGAETIGFCAVGSALRSANVHNNPRHEPITAGSVFRFDYGAIYDGYWGDLARTFVMGKPNPAQQKYHDAVKAAQEAGLSAVRPGVTADYIYKEALKGGQVYDPELRREHVGHGLGLEVHEEPVLRLGNEQVIEAGMVICVEVGKYLADIGGFQIEDTVLVTDTGIEILDSLPKGVSLPIE